MKAKLQMKSKHIIPKDKYEIIEIGSKRQENLTMTSEKLKHIEPNSKHENKNIHSNTIYYAGIQRNTQEN